MHCKSLWIKTSAKCTNVNANIPKHCRDTVTLLTGMERGEYKIILSLIPQSSETPTEEHRKTTDMTYNNQQETWGKTDYK